MKILIIRHADPDYSIDSLTEKGFKEAELLAHRMERENADYYYCSTLGRAKDTIAPTLKRLSKQAQYFDWLQEFYSPIEYPVGVNKTHCWDLLPSDYVKDDEFFELYNWHNAPLYKDTKIKESYKWVCNEFDKLLETHGYQRNGKLYNAVRPNDNTLALFCHFGLECVLLSH